jgi:glycosyltransferase involved in cell wall biosynthesis
VVVPTALDKKREPLIRRAIDSVLKQVGVRVQLVLVVNGSRFDADLLARLREDRRFAVLQMVEGNVSLARYRGLQDRVCDFFCFLDDDDELLPDSLRARVAALEAHPDWDVVAANGYIREAADELLVGPELRAFIARDPAGSFLQTNWFASASAMFRAARFSPEFFRIAHRHYEWTYLFWKLLGEGYRVGFCDAIAYRKYEDHPLAVARSEAYRLAHAEFLRSLMELPMEPRIRAAIRERYVMALNASCDHYLAHREARLAFAAYLKCLWNGGWRYVPKARKFIGLLLPPRSRST